MRIMTPACRGGGIGRRAGFKIRCLYGRVGSSPTLGTNELTLILFKTYLGVLLSVDTFCTTPFFSDATFFLIFYVVACN